ncbi:protein-disulfide reductase DsbD [Erwinia tasmaniensis]|uniref:protein-disulfide reductase DsbD n=1 Tax=Erwinia tasmaniensis TaxID=338565 RepID=UPI003A4D9793
MAHRITTLLVLLLTSLLSPVANASLFSSPAKTPFGTVNQAFSFDFSQQANKLTLSWQIKPGYYLYRQQIGIAAHGATLSNWTLPAGKAHEDEFYGKTEIYPENLTLPLQLLRADKGATITVTYQGCAAAGFCYPPETRTVPLSPVLAAGSGTPSASQENSSPLKASPIASSRADAKNANGMADPSSPADAKNVNTDSAVHPSPSAGASALPFSALWALLIGIGVAFTPCVLPMYPLISGIILGGSRRYSLLRLFALAVAYVQGMALTYTVMGVIVAAAGLRFQAALQSPIVLMGLAVLFTLLALSMFGLFTLQVPASVQTRLTLWSNRQQGGSLPGVFLMGALAGLICSPCTTAPLSAILLYIAQSGNMLAGAGTLYLYALGMGLPLIAVTLFGNRLLPKSGIWMQTVKEGFGFVILALPVFLLERIVGDAWGLRLWSGLGVAFFAWAFISLKSSHGWLRVGQIAMLAAALIVARPLQDWAFGSPNAPQTAAHLSFTQLNDVKDLNASLQQADGRITMLDLYADWCVACKEFEKYTFRDTQVQTRLSALQLLQADVTANSPKERELLEHLQVRGLPTILFFDANGHEIPHSRIAGYMDAPAFQQHLQKLTQ